VAAPRDRIARVAGPARRPLSSFDDSPESPPEPADLRRGSAGPRRRRRRPSADRRRPLVPRPGGRRPCRIRRGPSSGSDPPRPRRGPGRSRWLRRAGSSSPALGDILRRSTRPRRDRRRRSGRRVRRRRRLGGRTAVVDARRSRPLSGRRPRWRHRRVGRRRRRAFDRRADLPAGRAASRRPLVAGDHPDRVEGATRRRDAARRPGACALSRRDRTGRSRRRAHPDRRQCTGRRQPRRRPLPVARGPDRALPRSGRGRIGRPGRDLVR